MDESLIKQFLEKEYCINIDKVEKNMQSTDGNVYMIYTKTKKYVIKMYKDLEHTKSMIELHEKLKDNNIIAPEIIKTNAFNSYSRIKDEYIVMYSFIKGNSIKNKFKNNQLDDYTIYSIAQELKKLHSINKNCENILPNLPFEVNEPRKSILHFDLTRDNIFITDNNKIAFIDFDDAKFGASVCDVAIIISLFFFSKTRGANINCVHKFLNAYYENEAELKTSEVPKIKDISLNWIEYILNNNSFDSSTTESFEIKRNLIEKMLIL